MKSKIEKLLMSLLLLTLHWNNTFVFCSKQNGKGLKKESNSKKFIKQSFSLQKQTAVKAKKRKNGSVTFNSTLKQKLI